MKPIHLSQIFHQNAIRKPKEIGLLHKKSANYQPVSWQVVWRNIVQYAHFFKQIGLQKNCKVAIWSSNGPEWVYSDIGALSLGCVTVPIYVTLSPAEIAYMINDSSARILVVESPDLLSRLEPHLDSLKQLWGILVLNGSYSIKNKKYSQKIFLLNEFNVHDNAVKDDWLVNQINNSLSDQIATIIYTSGTTGRPKGVLLSHQNFIDNLTRVAESFPISSSDTHLSMLPLSHVFERLCGYYLMAYCGAKISYAQNFDTVIEDAKRIKPTFIMSVPRFYEKVFQKFQSAIQEMSESRKTIIGIAQEIALKSWATKKRKCDNPNLWEALKLKMGAFIFNFLVYQKLNKVLGGRIRFCVSGGAPLPFDVAQFFLSMNIVIIEGYGLTETSPVITMNRLDSFKFGTVGLPLTDTDVKIAENGEILTRSSCVMRGYYHLKRETEKVIQNNWFHTGDVGEIDSEGFLKITGRIKEIIVLSGGKKLCPTSIEAMFEKLPCITRCMLYGEGKNFLTALIVPDRDHLQVYAKKRQLILNKESFRSTSWIHDIIRRELNKVHKDLAPFEQIKYFALLEEDFSLDRGEITPTLKLRRKIIDKKYSHLLEPFYSSIEASDLDSCHEE